MTSLRLALVSALLAAPAAALAQAPGEPAPPPPPPEEAAAPEAPAATAPPPATVAPPPMMPPPPTEDTVLQEDLGVQNDPHMDKTFLSQTAFTQPAGSWAINNYELALFGVTYSFTDRIQASALVLPPYVEDMPLFGWFAGKVALVNQGQLRLAASGSLIFAHESNDDFDGETIWLGTLGGVGSICLNATCSGALSLGAWAAFGDWDGEQATPLALAASIVYPVAEHIKLVGEADTGTVLGIEDDATSLIMFLYGVRFHGRQFGIDLGLLKPVSLDGDVDTGPFILGFPTAMFSYRGGI